MVVYLECWLFSKIHLIIVACFGLEQLQSETSWMLLTNLLNFETNPLIFEHSNMPKNIRR